MSFYEKAEQHVIKEEKAVRKALEIIYDIRNLRHQKVKVPTYIIKFKNQNNLKICSFLSLVTSTISKKFNILEVITSYCNEDASMVSFE